MTSEAESPASSRAWRRKKYGSVPFVAATFLPLSSETSVMGEPAPTTIADHSGWENTSIARMAEPFARFRSAAEPAVEPTSIASALRASLALFEPADCTQLTVMSWSSSASSSQPWSLMMSESGL